MAYNRLENLEGRVFGRLKVVRRYKDDKNGNPRWICKCSCGNQSVPRHYALLYGRTTSCGCYGKEKLLEASKKHGFSNHPLYRAYYAMVQRCHRPSHPGYERYGGRGIKVCDEWKKDPMIFIQWGLDNGWKKGFHLDRIDNDGDYTPENCRFVTPRKNSQNTRIQKRRNLPTGIYKQKNRFVAQVRLGSFLTIEEAEKAYKEALKKLKLGE